MTWEQFLVENAQSDLYARMRESGAIPTIRKDGTIKRLAGYSTGYLGSQSEWDKATT